MQTLRHDGLEFEVTHGGPAGGRPVVLLHGFPGGTSTWEQLAPKLHAAGCRTYALHQRGYTPGARPSRVGDYRMTRLLGDVVALIEEIDSGPVCVVGHDWGGVVAWHLATRRADLVDSVVVLSTPHPGSFARSLLTGAQAVRSAYVVAMQPPVLPEAWLLARGGASLRGSLVAGGLSPSWADRYTAEMLEPGRLRGAINWYRAAVRRPTLGRVPAVDRPTTYVWSTRDVALGRRAAERTRDHVTGDYRFVVLDGCTHWIPEQHVDELWPAMHAHLERTG